MTSKLRIAAGVRARRWRNRLDNPEVKAGRRLVQSVRARPVRVLHFGASESLFRSDSDTDQRLLPAMIEDGLGPEVPLHSVAGAGYHPALFEAYLRLLRPDELPQVVVAGFAVRLGYTPWAHHPVYGYGRAERVLRAKGVQRRPATIRAAIPPATDAEMVAYDRLSYASLLGTTTIGERRNPLKNPAAAGLSGDDALQLLFDYHHGATAGLEAQWVPGVTRFGTFLHERGIRAVIYHMPVPVERGVELLGPRLREVNVENFRQLDAAFTAGYGPLDILQTGLMFGSDAFIDPDDGSEHVNQIGRQAIADLVTAEVGRALSADA